MSHHDDAAVDAFAAAMKEKLAKAREKGRGGWQTCPPEDLSRMLREHVEKGDPRDVANFCMFLWSLGASISIPLPGSDAFDRWSRGNLTAARASQPKGEAADALLECEIKPRPLTYPLVDYHRAMSEGPLNYTWQDKPHRLVYDLIAAVRYYAAPPAQPVGEAVASVFIQTNLLQDRIHEDGPSRAVKIAAPPAQPVAVPSDEELDALMPKAGYVMYAGAGHAWLIVQVRQAMRAALAAHEAARASQQEAPQQPAKAEPPCDCGQKPASQCEKWEPGCGLGQSAEHARVVAPQQPAEGVQAHWDAVTAANERYAPLVKAAINLLCACHEQLETKPAPQCYGIPYGALNDLKAALDGSAHPAASKSEGGEG